MPGDWVAQDGSRNCSWYAQEHSLAWQCYAGTALQKGGLCCGHNSNLGGRELSSTLRDLCWELKQVQYRTLVACSVSWGDGCHCSSLCLWFLPPNPSGTGVSKGTSLWVPFASVSCTEAAPQASICKLSSYKLPLIIFWVSNMFYLFSWHS